MEQNTFTNLAQQNEVQLDKLQQIVAQTIKEEKSIVTDVLKNDKDVVTFGQKVSDKVAKFGGSWKFIISFGILLIIWIIINSILASNKAFDPYPFILLNLILSCIAALQAPIIMMSQNRQEEKDRKRNENDYMINLKAELEIRSLHQKIDLLLQEQIKTLYETQNQQLELLTALKSKVDKLSS